MKKNINIIILSILFLQIISHKTSHNNTNSEYKTYLVKTQLTKQELETLLQSGQPQQVNLKENNSTLENEYSVEEVNDTLDNDDTLEEQIEKEIQEDALHPLDEFHVKEIKASEVKSFVVKPQSKFMDSLYEKRFGKIYAYLTLLLFIFVMIYYKDIIFNQKNAKEKRNYQNLFDYDISKEYMLVKTK